VDGLFRYQRIVSKTCLEAHHSGHLCQLGGNILMELETGLFQGNIWIFQAVASQNANNRCATWYFAMILERPAIEAALAGSQKMPS
jgi:hypothetical protein